jgi:alpha-L-fucosidase
MKRLPLLLLLCCLCTAARAQAHHPAHRWFEEARLGLFIHFGPYSVLCDGEWVMHDKSISVSDYHKLQHLFNPQLFDAPRWVALAKEAGMKYITFTSRHHDGFSNWNTRQSDWNIMHTPYGKDLVRQLADECHRAGLKLVFYYSLLDWSRTDYSHTTGRTGLGAGRTVQDDWASYLAFMKAQLTELLTDYGPIAGIWFDGEWDQLPEADSVAQVSHEQSHVDWRFDELYGLIHTLQPDCMIANNHHLPALPGEDYQAFEKDLPGESTGAGFGIHQPVSNHLPLETCETLNHSWGYRLHDNNYKTTGQLIDLLVRAAGYGANLLLNVGPMPTGEIDAISVSRLQELGQWMAAHGETIYGTTAGVVRPQSWGAATQKGDTHYIHILNKESDRLTLRFPAAVKSARWLNVDAPLVWKQNKKTGELTLSLDAPLDAVDSIVEVTLGR